MSHTSAGASQPGNRHVKSRQRTNRASAADGRYPGSQTGGGRDTGLRWAAAAISRSIGAGTAPNPGMYPGACELPSIVACSAMTSITTCPNGCWDPATLSEALNLSAGHGTFIAYAPVKRQV
jgi:hypothetical protein